MAVLKRGQIEMLGLRQLERFGRDLTHGVGILWRSPGFTPVGVISLALGIGANTAIFSLVDGLWTRIDPIVLRYE